MTIIFVITYIFADPAVTTELSGGDNVIMFAVIQGLTFGAGFIIVLYGVRMMLGEIVPAFKGISEKIIFSENYGYYDKLSKTKNLDKMILKAEEVRKNFRVNANYQLSLEELFIYMMEVAHG